MREQQIVITLKPEQFAQVQKLSKAAGAKSMGIFVRKALLAALGIEGAGKGQNARTAQMDPAELKALAEELKRMHIELRELVAEDTPASERAGEQQSGVTTVGSKGSSGAPGHAVPAQMNPTDSRKDPRSEEPSDEPSDQPDDSQSDIEEGNYSFADSGAGYSDDPLTDLLDRSLMSRLQDYLAHSRAEKDAQELEHIDTVEPVDEFAEPDDESEPADTQTPEKEQEISRFQPQNSPEPKINQNSPDISGGPPPKKGI